MNQSKIAKRRKKVFNDFLHSTDNTYEDLAKRHGISKSSVRDYVDYMMKKRKEK